MKFKFGKMNERRVGREMRRKAGVIHDPDLQFDGVMLENGVILERKPEAYLSLVDTMINCSSPVCSAQNTN